MSPNQDVTPNQIINDKYKIVKLIGTGGLGRVFQAVHLAQKQSGCDKVS